MNDSKIDYTKVVPTEVILDSRTVELGRFFTDEMYPQLLVLVEDEDDKPFWQKVFSCVADRYSSIDVWPLAEAQSNEQEQTDADSNILTAKGKDALMKVVGLGTSKMIAVDADYDLLIDDMHFYTNYIRKKKFVQHTSYHSIENHLLDDRQFVSMPEVKRLCEKIETYLYYVLGEEVHHVRDTKTGSNYKRQLTIDELRGVVGKYQYNQDSTLDDIDKLFVSSLSKIDTASSEEYSSVKTLCERSGYNQANLYQLIQGHTLYEFIEKIVVFTQVHDRQEKERQITNDSAITGVEKARRISILRHSILGSAKNEKEKFHNDIYGATYLNLTNAAIVKIQNKILDDLK